MVETDDFKKLLESIDCERCKVILKVAKLAIDIKDSKGLMICDKCGRTIVYKGGRDKEILICSAEV